MNRNIFRSRVNAVRVRRGKAPDCGMLPTGKRVRLIKWYLAGRNSYNSPWGWYARTHKRFRHLVAVPIRDRPTLQHPINWPKSVKDSERR